MSSKTEDEQPTDEEVAREVQQGQRERFGVLVERYQEKLLRYGRRMLFNGRDIEDVVQEIFLKVYKNIQAYDASRPFAPWVYRVAHSEFINAGKKRVREAFDLFDPDVFFPHPYAAQANPEEEAEREETKRFVAELLEKLEEKYREPIALFYLEALSYRDIGQILRLPVSTVGVRITRAKKQLFALVAAREDKMSDV